MATTKKGDCPTDSPRDNHLSPHQITLIALFALLKAILSSDFSLIYPQITPK